MPSVLALNKPPNLNDFLSNSQRTRTAGQEIVTASMKRMRVVLTVCSLFEGRVDAGVEEAMDKAKPGVDPEARLKSASEALISRFWFGGFLPDSLVSPCCSGCASRLVTPSRRHVPQHPHPRRLPPTF